MLTILNNLGPFFEDCYRQISVREYARIVKISPPWASKLLKEYAKDGYLSQKEERGHLLFSLNNANEEIVELSRLYWKNMLKKVSALFKKKFVSIGGVLFGSLSKAEGREDSDVDIAIFSSEKKPIDLAQIEALLKRKVSIHWFKSLSDVKNEHLLNNIINGVILFGRIKWK